MRSHLPVAAIALASCTQANAPDETAPQTRPEVSPAVSFANTPDTIEDAAEIARSSINPLENDLQGLEVAFQMPDAFKIRPGGASFTLDLRDAEGTPLAYEVFTLEPSPEAQTDGLLSEPPNGDRIETFRLAAQDHNRMLATETELKARRDLAPGQNILNLEGEAKPCALPGIPTPETYRLTLYFRTAPNVSFVPLTAEMVVDKPVDGPLLAFWDQCLEER